MANPTDLQQAIQATVEKHAASLSEALTSELRHLMAPARGPEDSTAIDAAFRRVVGEASQTAILETLLNEASAFAPRVLLLIAKGEKLIGWRGRGFAEAANPKGFSLPAGGPTDWKAAVGELRQAGSKAAPVPEPIAQCFFAAFGAPADSSAYLFPLFVKERVVAVLYADCGRESGAANLCALDLLTGITGMHLEIWAGRPRATAAAASAAPSIAPAALPKAAAETETEAEAEAIAVPAEATAAAASAAAAPPPTEQAAAVTAPLPPEPPAAPPAQAPRPAAGPDLTNVPERDHDVHKKAFRFAKLLADDLILYNKNRIEEGRAQRDIYGVLKDDIDKSRAAYERKWANTPAGAIDYFHQQLLARVAFGDPTILGTDYPGPLV
jgi:hypothetical protein